MKKSTARSTAREIFVDTSGLYSLIDRRDAHHVAARDIVVAALRGGRRLVVTDYVVCETVNLANARGGSALGEKVLELIETSAGIRVEWIGPERFAATRLLFRKHADHRYSFTDCTSFIVMHELKLGQALTHDRHFIEAGFQALIAR